MRSKFSPKNNRTAEGTTTSEWLETNGLGGYALSTVACCNTRKYHGLLVANLPHLGGPHVLLARMEESLVSRDHDCPISLARYAGQPPVKDNPCLAQFNDDKIPTFKFSTGTVNLVKQVMMADGKNTVLTRYQCTRNADNAYLRLSPLLAYRSHHGLTRENGNLQVRTFPVTGGFKIQPYQGMPPLYIQCASPFDFFPGPTWYRHNYYEVEADRGYAAAEDLFCPGMLEIPFTKGETVIIAASTTEVNDPQQLWQNEEQRRSLYFKRLRGTRFQKALKKAATQFLVKRSDGSPSIVAGYPWFDQWGRDAMIALPGLLLHNKSLWSTALNVLHTFADNAQDGIIPNFLAAGEGPNENAYNSVDATLWFIHAVQQYLRTTGRPKDVTSLLTTAKTAITSLTAGRMAHVHLTDDGLLFAGTPNTQLTWMDANTDGTPVTPRHGCPVEVNALFYNALRFLAEQDSRNQVFRQMAVQCKTAFNDRFWAPAGGYLYDVVGSGTPDPSIRPNQILAVALPHHDLLDKQQAQRMVNTVTDHLFTPLGLRTLSPGDPRFKGRYRGNTRNRDQAYHNGTVWPWLLGPYVDGVTNVFGADAGNAVTEQITDRFHLHLERDGIGSISEIFDGHHPNQGKGCCAQAWSVAEILRISLK